MALVDPIGPIQPPTLDEFLLVRLPTLAARAPHEQFWFIRQYAHLWLLPYDVVVKRYLRLLNRAMAAPLPPPPAPRRRFRFPLPTWEWLEQAVGWLAWCSDVLHHRPTLEESCHLAELRAQLYSHHSGAI